MDYQTNGYLRREAGIWWVETPKDKSGKFKTYTILDIRRLEKPLARKNRKISFLPEGLTLLTRAGSIAAGWNHYKFK
jgi:hypothetical protein